MSEFNPLEWIDMDLQESVDGIMSLCEPREECCERMKPLCREYILRVPLEIEQERFKYIKEQATSFLGYPILEEVVRCRDCRNFERNCKQGDRDAYYCAKVMLYVEPCGFCAWGERGEK